MSELPWWRGEVVYQIYPKSFCDSNDDGIGDLRGITSKLDYLKRLGVTMLWVCPIYPSPMADNGYDIADYRAIAPEFGTMEDFEQLVAEARQRDIKILLDLVINHTSDEHPWFKGALAHPDGPSHDYYIFKQGTEPPNNWRSVFGGSVWERVAGTDEWYFHSFGKKRPDLNWENPQVRRELFDMVRWWLDKGIAGFRVDAINFIKKDQSWADREPDGADGLAKCTKAVRNQPGMGTFLAELKHEAFEPYGCVTVAEAAGVSYDAFGEFIGEDGYFSMFFDFRHADLDIASGNEWFHRVPWTIGDLNERLMAGQLAIQPHGWSANFIENHDQPRATTKYLGEAQHDPRAVKTLGAMSLFLRGMLFIYQGQELGMVNFERTSIDQFDDLSSLDQYQRSLDEGYSPEEALHLVNLRSRDNARTPCPWTSERYGGFSKVEPWLAMTQEWPVINARSQEDDPKSVLNFYRSAISFRKEGPYARCLVDGDIAPLRSTADVIAYVRSCGDDKLYCWFNLGPEDAYEPLPEEDVKTVWFTDEQPDASDGVLHLRPWQTVLMARS